MQKAFTSGACGPNEAQGLGANPFTNFLDHILTGGADVAEKSAGYMNAEQMMAMQAQEEAFAQQQAMAIKQEQNMIFQNELQKHFDSMQTPQQPNMNEMNSLFQNMSLNATPEQLTNQFNQIHSQGPQVQAQSISASSQANVQPVYNPYMGGGAMMQPMMKAQVNNQGFDELSNLFESKEEVKQEPAQGDDQRAKVVSQDLINFLQNSSNPKFKQSKFLRFLKKINSGGYKIVGKQLEKDKQKLSIFKANQYAKKLEESKESNETDKLFEDAFKQFEKNYKEAKQGTIEEKIESYFKMSGDNPQDVFKNMFQEDNFFDGLAQEDYYQDEQPETYEFTPKNPFCEVMNPMETTQKFIQDQNVENAILSLEAEVQKNPENSEAWRQLGILHQENDEDEKALLCLKKGFEVDPLNQDILIALGISSINQLQEINALKHLQNWFRIHPEYNSIPLPENLQDPIVLKQELDKACTLSFKLKPGDPDIFVIKGVLDFLNRNYDRARQTFLQGVKMNPTDHTIWNKLGAALANSNQNEKAMIAYHQAIELKPTFVRAWANLGISCHNLGQHYESANYYLCALALNPDASHIWNYLQTSFIAMSRYDLVQKMKDHDVSVFKDEFEIVTRDTLHKPNLSSCKDILPVGKDNPLLIEGPKQ